MPKIQYIEKNFHIETLHIIHQAESIIEEYAAEGMSLTLRQLYYQFVSRDLIKNTPKEYNKLGTVISNARLAGLIDWDSIVDRTRNLKENYHNTDPGDAVTSALDHFRLDLWVDQEYRPEVWIEKEALLGVISGVCEELDVPYFACKGYNSQSEMWGASQRMGMHLNSGQTPVIIHLGDHDPSGIDMTGDIQDFLMKLLQRSFSFFYLMIMEGCCITRRTRMIYGKHIGKISRSILKCFMFLAYLIELNKVKIFVILLK